MPGHMSVVDQKPMKRERSERPLTGKVALVTGASANLGLGCCEHLAAHGAQVVLNYHRDERAEETRRAAAALEEAHAVEAVALSADVTRTDQTRELFEAIDDRFGRFDVLVNNAGFLVKRPISETTDEDFDRAFAVNARAPFLTMREAAKRIEDGGRIINVITSIVAFTIPFYGVYAGSKGAVEHMTKALAKELGDRGITANCVAAGPLDTSFYYAAETDESIAGAKSRAAEGRLGEVEDIAPLVAFLATPQARWINAQTVRANGGMA
jgi:NAD(P)-dependent dehydrogenase (short-subunit alcohol dehydrogenase family)